MIIKFFRALFHCFSIFSTTLFTYYIVETAQHSYVHFDIATDMLLIACSIFGYFTFFNDLDDGYEEEHNKH